MFPQTPKDSSGHVLQHLGDQGASRHAARSPTIPAKQEVADTTTGVSPWKDVHQQEAEDQPLPKRSSEEESEAAIPHWERQEPLPSRPGTSSRRPESSSGRLVVYKTAAQKKAEEAARRKRMDAETAAAAAGNLARPDTSSRKTSALPPLDERRRTKFAAPPSALPCDSLEAVGAISEVKGGAAWQLDAAEFVPEVSTCSSPVKRPSGRPPMAQKADVFTMDDNEESDGEEEEA